MVLKIRASKVFTVHTDLLFDSKKKAFVRDTSIEIDIDTGLVSKVYRRTSALPQHIAAPDIDLRGRCVLPGFVEAHAHIFLHAYSETTSLNQMRDESLVERTLRAGNHCRTALLAGYTTYRDLGTEGAGNNDVHVRDAINRGIIPGPRIFCATECLASSGGYEIRIESRDNGVEVPRICDPCDGPVGVRAGVRRRLGAGADVVKFYADYRKRELRWPRSQWPGCPGIVHPPGQGLSSGAERGRIDDERNPNLLLFTQEEMDAIVSEAKTGRAPVAAHACDPEAVIMAAQAGATTVEHGYMRSSDAVKAMKKHGTIFVPTLSVVAVENVNMGPVFAQTKEAFDMGVKLACGGDIGAIAHGDNAYEMELMLKAGVPMHEVLTAATLHGWEACGGDWCGRGFGSLERGWAADIIALDGDPRQDVKFLRAVDFVMKDGKVWKEKGKPVGMV